MVRVQERKTGMTRKLKFGVVAGALIAALTGTGFYWSLGHEPETIRLPGTVETQEVRLSSRVGGRVSKICVQEGDVVQEGQPLVYLEMPELVAQRDQVAARLQAAEAMLERAHNGP